MGQDTIVHTTGGIEVEWALWTVLNTKKVFYEKNYVHSREGDGMTEEQIRALITEVLSKRGQADPIDIAALAKTIAEHRAGSFH